MWLATLSFAAETSWLVGEAEAGSRLQALLAPHADANVTVGAAVAFGAAGRSARVCRPATSTARPACWRAVSANRRMGSPLWEATAQHDLAAVLRRRAGPGDAERRRPRGRGRRDGRAPRPPPPPKLTDPSALAGAP